MFSSLGVLRIYMQYNRPCSYFRSVERGMCDYISIPTSCLRIHLHFQHFIFYYKKAFFFYSFHPHFYFSIFLVMDALFTQATEPLSRSNTLSHLPPTEHPENSAPSQGPISNLPYSPFRNGHRRQHSEFDHSPLTPPLPPVPSLRTHIPPSSGLSLNPSRDRQSIDKVADDLGLPDNFRLRLLNYRGVSSPLYAFFFHLKYLLVQRPRIIILYCWVWHASGGPNTGLL